jgi:hypothetical protein
MANGASTAMESAIAELWDLRAPGPDNLFAAPAFARLRNACHADYPARGGGPTFALGNALRSLGLPCVSEAGATSTSAP